MTRKIRVKNIDIGGGAAITVQSMTSTRTEDILATMDEIRALAAARCDIVRCAVNTQNAAEALKTIIKAASIPVVADVHFDYRLALSAIANGAAKLRINPSNIGSERKVAEVIAAAKDKGVPIRIGVNGGSLDKAVQARLGNSAEALAKSALSEVALFERLGFTDIIISVKSSDVQKTVAANRILAAKCDYPLHLGVTEAGGGALALAKSAIGIGALLLEGIGDTIRVSLTAPPVEEVYAGLNILRALGLRRDGAEIVSCPTCGRAELDVIGISAALREALKGVRKPLKIAVMGCVVNGIGEAEEADFAVAGGKFESVIFENGVKICTVPNDNVLKTLLQMAKKEL